MDFKEFLQPLDTDSIRGREEYGKSQWGSMLDIYTPGKYPAMEQANIALIGVEEERGSTNNKGCASAPDYIRKSLYRLYKGHVPMKIADLGNIKAGHEVFDTYYAISKIVSELVSQDILPVIIGGSKDLTYANYLGYQEIRKTVNLVTVDPKLNLDNSSEQVSSGNYVSKILLHQPNILFDFSNLGYQSYLVDHEEVLLMEKLNFEIHRLGKVRSNLTWAEPVIRNADFLSFDLSAVKQSDAPAHTDGSPNGFFSDEICQLSRYAGMSDKLSSIGFYEVNPSYDREAQTAKLIAQMIWYFVDGYYNRKGDFPKCNKREYKKFVVPIKNGETEIIFYKSHKTDRWWMENPVASSKKNNFSEAVLTPCNYSDYEAAINNEIPNIWLKTFNKLR